VVSGASLAKYERLLRDSIYSHHSSFDFSDEIIEVGYPLTAQAMRQRNSGTPADDRTQMGNLGEVIGTEFARAFLEFETTLAFPKRLNANIDQPMKGADIIGLRDNNRPAELLIGEAKSYKQFDKHSIEEAYNYLVDLQTRAASRMLRFMKEALHLQEKKQQRANVDRHMAQSVPRHYLIVSITQSAPVAPFDIIAQQFAQVQLPFLVAVHIQICDLKGRTTKGKLEESESWLSKLFAP